MKSLRQWQTWVVIGALIPVWFLVSYVVTLLFRHLMQGWGTSLGVALVFVLPGLMGGLIGFAWGQIATHMLQPYLAKELPGVCRSCGYDLTANVSGVCPECGAAVIDAKRTSLE